MHPALLRLLDRKSYEPAALRELVRASPLIQSLFVLDPQGNRLHPPPDGPLTGAEQEFLDGIAVAESIGEKRVLSLLRPSLAIAPLAELTRHVT